ncbi:hypothetical protein ANANG_G00265180 [Anguilla anguilla]|uniref:Ras modification protein ERF4 n=1 Tax=Anguilla anguilla TaxID=7936 RepID=A0A9D3RLG3_ANGAN|nr:hypothetical protein ANANG_G00265180 [Anguilla anguilla]
MPIQRDCAHYVVWNNFIIVVVSEGLPMRGALSKTEAGRDFNMAETHSLQDLRQQAAIAAKVFVQRDYSSGTICQFQTKFPSELENRIDRQQFEETIRAELAVRRGGEARREVLPGGVPGLPDRLHRVPVHGDSLREGPEEDRKGAERLRGGLRCFPETFLNSFPLRWKSPSLRTGALELEDRGPSPRFSCSVRDVINRRLDFL